MRQLTGLDAAFLALDTPTSTGHVGGVHIVEGHGEDGEPSLTIERLMALVRARIHLVPPMRRRVVEVPLGLDEPYWIDDPDFDLEFHVRELALPSPGTIKQLTEQVARIHSRHLDRTRPLWELYLIHGLESDVPGEDRKAIYAKLHHAMIDGVASQEITAALLDLSPHGREVPTEEQWTADSVPGSAELLARSALSLVQRPRRAVNVVLDLAKSSRAIATTVIGPRLPFVDQLQGVLDAASMIGAATGLTSGGRSDDGSSGDSTESGRRRSGDGDASHGAPEVLYRTPVRAPATPFNAPVSPHRRLAFTSVSLSDVKVVRAATGLTVNDVVMGMCAGALRRWLTDHDALPRGPLVAAVPVSVRARLSPGSRGTSEASPGSSSGSGSEVPQYGNQISLMLSTLPTNLADPAQRLAVAHQATKRAKEQHSAVPAALFGEIYSAALPALVGLAMRANARLRVLERVNLFNLFISNVPGPNVPLYVAGSRVLASYPVSAITDGQGLNITVVSYLGRLFFGLVADRELVPDLDTLADYLEDELRVLRESPADNAAAPPPGSAAANRAAANQAGANQAGANEAGANGAAANGTTNGARGSGAAARAVASGRRLRVTSDADASAAEAGGDVPATKRRPPRSAIRRTRPAPPD